MLVPDIESVVQLLVVALPSLRAETMLDPGADLVALQALHRGIMQRDPVQIVKNP